MKISKQFVVHNNEIFHFIGFLKRAQQQLGVCENNIK